MRKTTLLLLVLGSLLTPAARAQTAPAVTAEEMAAVPRITVNELKAAREAGDVVVIDVRNSTQFEDAHIAGALHATESLLAAATEGLAPDTPIVTYCA